MASGGLTIKLNWNGDKVNKAIGGELLERLERFGITYKTFIIEGISKTQPTTGRGVNKKGLDPSQGGEYPKVVTGILRAGFRSTLNKRAFSVRIWTNTKYAPPLQFGTRRMARRPFMTLALTQNKGKLQRTFSGRVI